MNSVETLNEVGYARVGTAPAATIGRDSTDTDETNRSLGDEDSRSRVKRHLFGYSILLFLIGMMVGGFEYFFPNMEMGNIAHIGSVTNAAFLGVLAAAWSNVRLGPRASTIARWLLVVGTYLGCIMLVLAALWNTKILTPIGAGRGGEPWQELIVGLGLITFAPMQLIGTIMVMVGLHHSAQVAKSRFFLS